MRQSGTDSQSHTSQTRYGLNAPLASLAGHKAAPIVGVGVNLEVFWGWCSRVTAFWLIV